MTSSIATEAATSGVGHPFRKNIMGYALALSLVLHAGAALVVIIASSSRMDEKIPGAFSIQEVSLAPSISAPPKPPAAVPEPHPVITASSSDEVEDKPAEEAASTPSKAPGKESGLLSTPLGLGMTHGYFSSISDGRSLRDDIRGYYFEMVEKINREWWEKAGLLKEPLRRDGIFELFIQRDGTISSIRNLQGTGSGAADRLLTEIIRSASPLPPLPATYDIDLFRAPLRIKAPSSLFRIRD